LKFKDDISNIFFSAIINSQNAFGSPACRKIAFAVWRLGIPTGTAKFRSVIGLCQISWLPRPCRTSVQPAARSKSRS
jgi:hypothetical protein